MEHRSLGRTGVSVSNVHMPMGDDPYQRGNGALSDLVHQGTTINHADTGWTARALAPADRRR